MRRAFAFAALVVAVAALGPACAGAAMPSVVEVNALARAAGNRKEEAVKIGLALLATRGPAQILKIRVDAVGSHQVAGILLSGENLIEPVDAAGFIQQTIVLIEGAFAASDVEEVDLWATVPIAVPPGAIVSGDLAVPVSRIVFAASARRADRQAYAMRLRAGTGVYWASDWRAELDTKARAARGPEPSAATPNHANNPDTVRAAGS
jgi:hypothetical protein